MITDPNELTPVERYGNIFLKRDDLFGVEGTGCYGGKSRSCWVLSQGAIGLVTGSSRISPQQQIVSRIAEKLSIPCRVHTALGVFTPEMLDAQKHGAVIVQWHNGFSSNLACWASKDPLALNYTIIPFGMQSALAIHYMRRQVDNVPLDVKRIVIILGSGISASGVLWGLKDICLDMPVVGIRVGGGDSGQNILRRLNRYAPPDWARRLKIIQANVSYENSIEASIDGIVLDSHYEAKAFEFLKPDDLFWIVGTRPKVSA